MNNNTQPTFPLGIFFFFSVVEFLKLEYTYDWEKAAIDEEKKATEWAV